MTLIPAILLFQGLLQDHAYDNLLTEVALGLGAHLEQDFARAPKDGILIPS